MLPAKPWKTEAVMRFCISVVVCIFAGVVVTGMVQEAGAGGKAGTSFYVVSCAALLCFLGTLAALRRSWRAVEQPGDDMGRVIGVFAVPLVLFYSGFFLEAWVPRLLGKAETETHIPGVTQMVISVLFADGGALLLIWLFLREHRMTWLEGFGFGNEGLRSALFGLLSGSLFLPIAWGLQMTSWFVLTHWHIQPAEQLAIQTLQTAAGWGQRLTLGLVTIVLAPAAEELSFRGIFYPWLKGLGRPRLALWGTSLVFALMHFNAVSFVPLFALSIMMTLLYEKTGNLLAPFSTHALFNGVNFSMLYWVDKQPL